VSMKPGLKTPESSTPASSTVEKHFVVRLLLLVSGWLVRYRSEIARQGL